MNTRTFFRWLEMHDVQVHVCDAAEHEACVNRVLGLVSGKQIHNLWEIYDSPYYLFGSRMKNEQDAFENLSLSVFDGDQYYLIIDDVCFSDASEPVTLRLSGESLVTILSNFYLYLDEIYITVSDGSWFVSINHHSDLMFFGDRTKGSCYPTEKRVRDFFESSSEETSDQQ